MARAGLQMMKADIYGKVLLLVLWMGAAGGGAEAAEMQKFTIDLPRHEIRFAAPAELVADMGPDSVSKSFNPDVAFSRQGESLAYLTTDFNGPFWVGAYGSLEFFLTLQPRVPGYEGDITSVDGLEPYIRAWWKTLQIGNKDRWRIVGRSAMNGKPAVLREIDEFDTPGTTEPQHRQIFSVPLDEQYFLDVGFVVRQWKGGNGKEKRWLPKARAMRDAIAATVTVTPKR